MAYDNGNGSDRPMYSGNWTCAGCGAAITELPFQPDPARAESLLCRDCHRTKRDGARRERPMFRGNWSCSQCGGSITELPFQPDPSREGELKCRDCHRAGRA